MKPVAFAIILVLLFYGFLISQGLPQKWTLWSNDHDVYYAAKKSKAYADDDADIFRISPYGNKALWLRGENEPHFRVEWSREDFTPQFSPDEANSARVTDPSSAKTITADLRKLIEHQLEELYHAGIQSDLQPEGPFYVRVVKVDENDETLDIPNAVSNVIQINVRTPHPPIVMVVPFVALLLCIAFLPLIPATAHWWESNTHRFIVAGSLGFLTLLYYFLLCDFPVEQHWPVHGIVDPTTDGNFMAASTVFLNAILYEFLPFIVLLFSLFVIAGGIRIAGNLRATPFVNSVILLIGGLLASFIGTTGAAVLLIRLLLETNKERKFKVHTVVFFIFIVCNCGGCLTPLGDPPLFLGYLRGVPFEWTFFLWAEWMFVNLSLIAMFFLWDKFWYYRRESAESKQEDDENVTSISITGWMLNIPLLLGVVAAVAFLDPSRPVPGTDWHPWFYLREAVQLGLAATSLLFSSYLIRKANSFNFLAIGEVAALFFGIFLCMQAPLQILGEHGKTVVTKAEQTTGVSKEQLFFWSTGSLSAVLDNAPTYVVFFDTARTLTPNTETELEAQMAYDYKTGEPIIDPETGEQMRKWHKDARGVWRCQDGVRKLVPLAGGTRGFIEHALLIAVSLGAVFCGALTYIGNGPNFMIKAIAEQDGVKMPSFFGYMCYSLVLLLPLLILMTLIFLPLFP